MAQSQSPDDMRARLRAKIAAIQAGSGNESMKDARISCPSDSQLEREGLPAVSGGRRGSKDACATRDDGDDAERAFRKIERLASAREQASEALRRRLAREGFGERAVEQAVERALACGLVDDGRYADVLVRSRISQGKGRRGIVAELASLGIDPDGVAALSAGEGDEELEVERALVALARKPPRSKNPRNAAYCRLIQKGFSASVAATAARLWCERSASL